eukprot:4551792-Pyramimonas_sp.AAC.1
MHNNIQHIQKHSSTLSEPTSILYPDPTVSAMTPAPLEPAITRATGSGSACAKRHHSDPVVCQRRHRYC